MSENKSASVHIPREHQSAPKKSWADIEVEKAAEEIREGKFIPDLSDDLPFSVGLQRGDLPNNPLDIDMQSTRDSLALAQHPRVLEALERLKLEKREARNSQEAMEKAQMMYELNEEASKANQWDGQGRWIGTENEEMRHGKILTPQQFLKQLTDVIGERRVFINRYAVAKRVALLAPERGERPLIIMPGQEWRGDNKTGMCVVGTLQWPCSTEWMIMRFDEYHVPTEPKYLGWRTALLSMITLGVITEKEAHKAFPLGEGPAGDWYRQQLKMYRSAQQVVN